MEGLLKLISADIIVLVHFGFILFVIFGGLLTLKWKPFIWLHIPAAVWGALIEFTGWICPLTTLENELRRNHGEGTYSTGFIEHYITPVIYPEGLTRNMQIMMGVAVVLLNLFIYTRFYKKWVLKK